jgi:hypothetical protein
MTTSRCVGSTGGDGSATTPGSGLGSSLTAWVKAFSQSGLSAGADGEGEAVAGADGSGDAWPLTTAATRSRPMRRIR